MTFGCWQESRESGSRGNHTLNTKLIKFCYFVSIPIVRGVDGPGSGQGYSADDASVSGIEAVDDVDVVAPAEAVAVAFVGVVRWCCVLMFLLLLQVLLYIATIMSGIVVVATAAVLQSCSCQYRNVGEGVFYQSQFGLTLS